METDDRSKLERSRTMRAVKSKDTKPELYLRSLVHRMGYRFRLHRKDLPGKPDLVFPSRRKVIFLHGCFWHGHDCARGDRLPKANQDYWLQKIGKNKARDSLNICSLQGVGWQSLVIWECELKDEVAVREKVDRFLSL